MTGNLPSDPKELSLYLHAPFCTKRCSYCDFQIIKNQEERHQEWKEALLYELSARLPPLVEQHQICSIYFGGGTPSLIDPSLLEEILSAISLCARQASSPSHHALPKTPEITLEANPNDLTALARVEHYASIGIDRVSLGAQSFDDRELQELLGREHRAQQTLIALEHLFACGIHNVSIDLIQELPRLPGEADFKLSMARALNSVRQVANLAQQGRIHHLSLYNLLIQKGTLMGLCPPDLPAQEEGKRLHDQSVAILERAGLKRYEISAFAKKGYESLHNSGYWRGRSYLGLGPGAHSFLHLERTKNIRSFTRYVAISRDLKQGADRKTSSQREVPSPPHLPHLPHSPHSPHTPGPFDLSHLFELQEKLPPQALAAELLAMHLRLLDGVDLEQFEMRWGPVAKATSESIEKLLEVGLVEQIPLKQGSKERSKLLRLTRRGQLLYNRVGEELIMEAP